MDRRIIYPGQIPLDTDLLYTNKNAMVGLAKLAAAALGVNGVVNGLSVVPTGPASLNVNVTPGEIYQLANIDATSFGSLSADTTHQVLKQGIMLDAALLSCPAPGTGGQSINYLIQATLTESDTGAVALPYYNASNPSVAWSGPANSGTPQATQRSDACVVTVKAGAAAATGTQTTPAPDANNIGLGVVTVANGQATITAANIVQYTGAALVPSDGLASNVAHAIYTKNVAGAADVTLTPQEAAYPIIVLTGALTGNINLIVPASVRQRIIDNETSGAFQITVKTAAGTGVVAPQSFTLPTFCDGTNVESSVSALLTQTQGDARYAFSGALGNNKIVIIANYVMTVADSGKIIDPYSASGVINITLPNVATIAPSGFNIIINPSQNGYNLINPVGATISVYHADGSSAIAGPGSLAIPAGIGNAVRIYEFANSWRIEIIGRTVVRNPVNANEAVNLGQFITGQVKSGNVLNQPIAGGVIVKTGQTAAIAPGATTVTYPVAFPNGTLAVIAMRMGLSGGAQAADDVNTFAAASFVINNSGSTSVPFTWIAIGF